MGSEEDNLEKYGDESEVRNGHKDGTKQTAEAELLHVLISSKFFCQNVLNEHREAKLRIWSKTLGWSYKKS